MGLGEALKRLIAAAALGLLALGAADAAEIRVLMTQGAEQAYRELVPPFERETGHKVTTVFTGTIDAARRVSAGERYDVLIMPEPAIAPYFADGTLNAESRVDIARSGAGFAVKAGAPKPDISSIEALKAALLEARSIGYSTGPTGTYFLTLIQNLGIADRLRAKLKQAPSGVFVGSMIASGEVEIGFQQIGELSRYPGVAFIGPLPREVQIITVFSGGVPRAAKEPDAAREFLRFLASPAAAPAYRARGMEPG